MNKNNDFFMKKACDLAEYSITMGGGRYDELYKSL